MRFGSITRTLLALFIGFVIAVILIHPTIDLLMTAPSSSQNGHQFSRRFAPNPSVADSVAFAFAMNVFAPDALGAARIGCHPHLNNPCSSTVALNHVPLLC
jgi:hypothetical protein